MNTATLIIGGFSSWCSACSQNADPGEKAHEMLSMQGEGCGAEFVDMISEYGEKELCEKMRPDLPYKGWDKKELQDL